MLRIEFMNNSCVPLVLSSLRWKAAKPSGKRQSRARGHLWSFVLKKNSLEAANSKKIAFKVGESRL